jgi:hypothetical protein
MQTLLLNVNTELNTKELLYNISMLKGINEVKIVDDLDDNWENWTDEEETNYLLSIPGFKEKLEKTINEPIEECIPIEEVWADWNNV